MVEDHVLREELGNSKECILVTSFICDELYKQVLRFSVVLLVKKRDVLVELIRFDGREKEAAHVHKFYLRDKLKIWLGEEITFDLIEECVMDIRANWMKYLLLFEKNSNYYI